MTSQRDPPGTNRPRSKVNPAGRDDAGLLGGSLPAYFEEQVVENAERLAVRTAQTSLTYSDLNAVANRVAHRILAVGPAARTVALLFDRGTEFLVAFLAVLKAGKIAVPLDRTYPRARTDYMLTDAQCEVIVTDTANKGLALELAQGRTVVNSDELPGDALFENPSLEIEPSSYAYLLCTSGSTGEPKGVIENHRNVLHFSRVFAESFPIVPDDRITLLTSCSFSASMADIFGALLNGASRGRVFTGRALHAEALHGRRDSLPSEYAASGLCQRSLSWLGRTGVG
jgi:surfactin family lipopeptide synthetase A